MMYGPPLQKVVSKVITRLGKRKLLEGVSLSDSHKSDSGIKLSGIDDKSLMGYLYKNPDVLWLHGTKPAKDSWHEINGFVRPLYNAAVIELCKYLPYLPWFDKNVFYRSLGIKIGKNTTVAPRVQFDYFHPELIEIGDNCLIGDGVKIWSHDYGIDYFMIGRVKIGDNVRIGTESIIGPSIIGNNVKINLGAFVYGRVPNNTTVSGREVSRRTVDKS